MSSSIDEILHFWFEELSRKDWFRKDEALDSTIATRFGAVYRGLRDGVPADRRKLLLPDARRRRPHAVPAPRQLTARRVFGVAKPAQGL